MSIISYQGKIPRIHSSVFVAEGVHIIGDVTIDQQCSLWFNTVVRGDVNFIRIGERTNIQDNAVLHVTHQRFPLVIGSNVTIGHGAVVHAATVHDYCLIGMGAVVLDNATIGPFALVSAGAVVTGGSVIPEGALAAGVPARVVRSLTEDERQSIIQSAQHYIDYVASYRT